MILRIQLAVLTIRYLACQRKISIEAKQDQETVPPFFSPFLQNPSPVLGSKRYTAAPDEVDE